MTIKVEEIEAALKLRGYAIHSETKKKRAYQKASQLPVYLNLTSKSGMTSMVIHPHVAVDAWRDKVKEMAVTIYHSSNMRLFPKRVHRGHNPIPYGWALTFDSMRAVGDCLDFIEGRSAT